MKYFVLIVFMFFSFETFASWRVGSIGSSCTSYPDYITPLQATPFLTKSAIQAGIKTAATGSNCGSGLDFMNTNNMSNKVDVWYGRNGTIYKVKTFYISGSDGCTFDDCKSIAESECKSLGSTLNQDSYFYRGNSDYDAVCNDPPPEEPVKTEEECFTHASNSCNTRGSVSDMLFTDNNDFTYECTFTCGDGSTGDENGSHAGNSDGICNQDDPNDLIDCDTPVDDPDCVGCGAFTPDETTDLPYNPDGTTGTDGTGTDGITSTQGDVLINEVKKLKNENAEQTIKSANAITNAVADINNDDKLQGIIDAVNNSSGGSSGNTYNDSGLRSDVNSLEETLANKSNQEIAADASNTNAIMANDNTNAGQIVDAINGLGDGLGSTQIGRNIEPSENLKGFYTSVYPTGVNGMFEGKIEGFKTTEFYVFLEQFKPTFTGAPPNMSFCMNFGAYMNLGCFDLVLDPRIWPALKIFILITAGFTCRKILFGG